METEKFGDKDFYEALCNISKSIKILGSGNIDRNNNFPGSVERLNATLKESSKKIVESLDGIAHAIDELNQTISSK